MASPSRNRPSLYSDDDDDDDEEFSSNARPEDVQWLSSLSEPELDFLIGLRELATKRAKNAGCKDLANKFDLRMLRALGAVLLEHLKESLRNRPMFSNKDEILESISGCSLAVPSQENIVPLTSKEDHKALTSKTPIRKRMWDGLCVDQASQSKRQKTKETQT